MMKRLRYLALAALVAFAACDEEGGTGVTQPETGTVAGTVTADGAGVAGVTVTLAGGASQSATTGANGGFTFSNVPVGNYVVTISGVPGDFTCTTTAQPVTVTANQTSNAAFTCNVIRTASISGTVTAGANPIAGATIAVTGPNNFNESRQTSATGQYQLTGLRSGAYVVTLTPPTGVTCNNTTANVTLVAGEAEIVNFGCEGGGLAPEVTIESITVGGAGTMVPADPDSIAMRVEVSVNIDRNDADLTLFRLMSRDVITGVYTEICRQTFTQGVSGAEEPQAQDDLDITCSWNTDRTRDRSGASTIQTSAAAAGPFAPIAANANRPYHPIWLNGNYELIARVEADGVDPVSATVDLTLRNMDAVNLGITSDNSDVATGLAAFPNTLIDPVTGLRWISGDVHITVYPIIFQEILDPNERLNGFDPANPLLARAAFSFDGFTTIVGGAATDVTRGGAMLCQPSVPEQSGCQMSEPAATTNGTFTFSFCHMPGAATALNGRACYRQSNGTTIANIGGVAGAAGTGFNTGDIGARRITLQTVTRFGQFGPTLANLKSVQLFDQDLASGARGVLNDVLRIDNEGPARGAMSLTAQPHPANALVGAGIFSRTAFFGAAVGPFPGSHYGWVTWTHSLNGLVIDPPACGAAPCQDAPTVYPVADQFGTVPFGRNGVAGGGDDGFWCDPAGDLCRDGRAGTAALLSGIGLPAGANKPEQVAGRGPGYADPTDPGSYDSTPSADEIITGQNLLSQAATAADLPPEAGAGLTDQCPNGPVCSAAGTPYSDTELDYGLAARHWDRFGNLRNTGNFILLGVDGKEPIYSNATGISQQNPTDPTAAGTVYDPFDDDQHVTSQTFTTFGQVLDAAMTPNMLTESQKIRGTLSGWTTDRGNGFSGVAGVVMQDHEYRCAAGVNACAGAIVAPDPRYGYTLAAGAGGATVVLPFVFSEPEAGTDTFLPVGFDAYVAANMAEAAMDGYRDQIVRSYDRAGNLNLYDNVNEGNADHTSPQVGNVQMPTPPVFVFGTAYAWGGETRDAVDLKWTDFSFDFNAIMGLQMYVDAAGVALPPTRPAPDVDGHPFEETSLQLPLQNVAHTAFGSASILTHTNLSVSQTYLGCLIRADEKGIANDRNLDAVADAALAPYPAGSQSVAVTGAGAGADFDFTLEPHPHRPRGPRWRTWDHSFFYGLVNTQWNTFTTTSVTGCRTVAQLYGDLDGPDGIINTADDIFRPMPQSGPGGDGISGNADDGSGPDGMFGTPDDDVAWLIEIRGGTPVITFKGPTSTFVPNIDVTDIALYYLDTAGRARLLDPGSANWTLIVSDLGAGAFGRSYEYTYTGALPGDLIAVTPPANTGTTAGWFFVVNIDVRPGHAFIWDQQSNP